MKDVAHTHAILVAVENYAGGWNLNGPLRDVLEFHRWLHSCGVPQNQITVVASPLPENEKLLKEANLDATKATSEGVRSAFNNLRAAEGDLLFVFWGGHGFILKGSKGQKLLVADASDADKRNYDLDQLLRSLGSSYFPAFSDQIILVDACANYEEFPFGAPSEQLPVGAVAQSRNQFVFFAAQPGQVAKNLGEERRGLFSREFLSEADKGAEKKWPPDMDGIARRVQSRFAALLAAGKANQAPMYEWSRDWSGNVIELKPFAGAAAGAHQADSWKLTFEQLAALTDALLECRAMRDSDSREDVLGQVRLDIRNSVDRRPAMKADVANIVQTASDFEGGLEELLTRVRYFEGPTHAWKNVEGTLGRVLPRIRLTG